MKTIKDRITNQPKHNGKEDCKKCFGKGYSTELSATSWSSDFGDDVSGMEEMLNFKPCTCVSKPSKQPADTKSVETSGDLVNCECCEESDYQKLSDALGTPCKPAYDLGFEAGRQSVIVEMREKFNLWAPTDRYAQARAEQKSQDEMKKQFNKE